MFCPNCGIDDKQPNQFCRACGADMRAMLSLVDRTDGVTSSAVSAREEVGRAGAAKIRDLKSGKDLKIVTENVLPEIEKFLESPAEKRLRRIRTGAIIMLVGIGVFLAFGFLGLAKDGGEDGLLFLSGLGVVAAFIGLAFFANGLFFSVPRGDKVNVSEEKDRQELLDSLAAADRLPEASVFSTTEHTT
ncbi:MAG TPA: hypothetical protein PKA82_12265, partial [Pyrinomonadaceae bacterium]|nr:hypothetical protein [Pyrinomonadaceae bacterium]